MKLRRILTVVVFTLMAFQSQATHLLGGEIVWKCKNDGKYQFTLVVYRECGSSVTIPTTAQTLTNNAGVAISCSYISTTDVTPSCYSGTEPCVAGANLSGLGRMQKYVFRSGDITLTGTPPANGWTFSWTSCCRPQSVANVSNAGGVSYWLRATMYPYTPPGSTSPLSAGSNNNPTCYDSSPDFLEDPQVVACADQDVIYNNLGYDPDLDSLYYIWANPLGASGAAVPWSTGFSTTNQLPSGSGSTAAVLSGEIGTISFNSTQTGSFATCIGIEAWRCNQKVAEIYRDIPVVIRSCSATTGICASLYTPVPPEFTVTPDSSLMNITNLAPVTNTSGDTVAFRTEGYPGDTIRFKLSADDPYVNPNCNQQDITLLAKGGNLSSASNYGNANMCLFNPPCATLASLNTNNSFTSNGSNSVLFNWELQCNHLFYQEYICGTLKSEYEFYFRMQDDQCPVPLTSYAKVIVKVKNYMPGLPDLTNTCIYQDNNGVTFDWAVNPDTGFNWDYYLINHIDTLGNLTIVDTIFDWSTQSYTHTGADPNAVNAYTIQVGGGCGLLTEPTDTIQNVRLNLQSFPPPPNASIANLDWNSWRMGDTSTVYDVWVEAPLNSGSWVKLGSTTKLEYSDTVAFCGEWLKYQIRYKTSCESSSDSGYFSDKTPPSPVVFDSVTVAGGDLAAMSWVASSDSDVVYYRVLKKDVSGFWQPIDSISAIQQATSMPWVYSASNAANESEVFLIQAVDSCGNYSSVGLTTPSSTIYLKIGVDPCDGFARLRWNTYKEWTQTAPASYDLWVEETDPFGSTTTMPLKQGTLDTTFNHYNIINGYTYCYYVRAIDTSGTITSTSNRVCNSSAVVQKSMFLYLGRASVTSQNGVDLFAYIDPTADVIDYQIQRSESEIGPYMTIGTVAKPTPAGTNEIKFIDFTGDPTSRSYYYRLASRDSCGAMDTVSNLASNMLLGAEAIGNLTNQLSWSAYRDFDGGVDLYEVHRSIDGGGSWMLAGTTSDTAYLDDIKPYSTSKGKFCYKVKAIAKDGIIPWRDEYNQKFNAWSNVGCTVHKARIWVPSGFTPNGDNVNEVWKPVGVFARPASYSLVIRNRWGQEVFRTNDINKGWDGTYSNGGVAESGLYTYYIKYRSIEDVPIEEYGYFNVITNKE